MLLQKRLPKQSALWREYSKQERRSPGPAFIYQSFCCDVCVCLRERFGVSVFSTFMGEKNMFSHSFINTIAKKKKKKNQAVFSSPDLMCCLNWKINTCWRLDVHKLMRIVRPVTAGRCYLSTLQKKFSFQQSTLSLKYNFQHVLQLQVSGPACVRAAWVRPQQSTTVKLTDTTVKWSVSDCRLTNIIDDKDWNFEKKKIHYLFFFLFHHYSENNVYCCI